MKKAFTVVGLMGGSILWQQWVEAENTEGAARLGVIAQTWGWEDEREAASVVVEEVVEGIYDGHLEFCEFLFSSDLLSNPMRLILRRLSLTG